jgi:hypothetical protein
MEHRIGREMRPGCARSERQFQSHLHDPGRPRTADGSGSRCPDGGRRQAEVCAVERVKHFPAVSEGTAILDAKIAMNAQIGAEKPWPFDDTEAGIPEGVLLRRGERRQVKPGVDIPLAVRKIRVGNPVGTLGGSHVARGGGGVRYGSREGR